MMKSHLQPARGRMGVRRVSIAHVDSNALLVVLTWQAMNSLHATENPGSYQTGNRIRQNRAGVEKSVANSHLALRVPLSQQEESALLEAHEWLVTFRRLTFRCCHITLTGKNGASVSPRTTLTAASW